MNSKYIFIKYSLTAGSLALGFLLSLKVKDKNTKLACAGLLGQVTTDFLFHPIDLVNTRTKYFYMENIKTWTITKRIASTTGVRGFFRGGSVTILGSSIGGFVYFYLYKRIRDYMKKLLEKDNKLFFVAYTVASFISEIVVYIFYYPFDLVKTRIQTGQYEYKNFFDASRQIWDKNNKLQSIKNFYSGFVPSVTLSTTSMTLTFFTFEVSRDYYAKKNNIHSDEVSGLDYLKCCFISGVVTAFSLNFMEVYTIQKVVHGKDYSLKTFLKPKHFLQATTSGLLARNLYGIFYTVFWLEVVKIFGKIYDVSL